MTDITQIANESEVPVNPYSLLEAVNDTSDDARTGWFIFLGVMTYLLVAVAGIGHKDLLLAKEVQLPIVQVSIDLQSFFLFAPIVLCFLHFGMLVQNAMLARKVIEFDVALRALEPTEKRSHPLRLELHSYFFTQSLAGPVRSPLMSFFLHVMAWITLVALPVMLLIYIQVAFLPFHDVTATWVHRIAIVVDIMMLLAVGVFLIRPDTSFWHAFWRTSVRHPITFSITGLMMLLVAVFSFCLATVPDEPLDSVTQWMVGSARNAKAKVKKDHPLLARLVPAFAVSEDGSFLGIKRNLYVSDSSLLPGKKDATLADPSAINLRGRDLRHAKLDRLDLRRADFTGADLSEATLIGTDLRGAIFNCQEGLDDLKLRNFELTDAQARELAKCVSLRGAHLEKANAAQARFQGADLSNAVLVGAVLEEADLSNAVLYNADLSTARLEKAELTGGVDMMFANLSYARLQSANLDGAKLHGANLNNAKLQSALLPNASLHGADLTYADLTGADLARARLLGADLGNAQLRAADLREAYLWLTKPPALEAIDIADLTGLKWRDMPVDVLDALKKDFQTTKVGLKEKVEANAALARLIGGDRLANWAGGEEQKSWGQLASRAERKDGDPYCTDLTRLLLSEMCKDRFRNAEVATGVAKRAKSTSFRGNAEAIYGRMSAAECVSAKLVRPSILRDLASAIDEMKSVPATTSAPNCAALR
jgi:uncharacterized protein YjbI with pentapeptide repeats